LYKFFLKVPDTANLSTFFNIQFNICNLCANLYERLKMCFDFDYPLNNMALIN
jgi:hypothetical protein